mmetsp:Transcript_16332/g.18809  ORF Transcript_16332/g.18809 Transcript_16332/m.18809 type:complete len:102 (-) Transcript_16332:757-1062(-)
MPSRRENSFFPYNPMRQKSSYYNLSVIHFRYGAVVANVRNTSYPPPVRCHKKASGTGYIAIEACSTTMLLPPKLWQPTSTQPKNRQQCHKAYNKACARASF